ncbi:hypothetical protein Mal4_18270 [Maioricimonas rarisocia]|uniref:DUF1559 domain-containing protein n=1 Tax=Maioricimonas rarisocia TaxID=2528026 RepID=A0A517Z4Y9_9PLAN|nr:DUF1559 domain-containing protein [Maioricimonas rarisocia]QDU37513.1 hypothetical protein Mal4_18270 [Maioricimonas rarisocia]
MSPQQAKIAWGTLLASVMVFCVALSVGRTQSQDRADASSGSPAVETLLPADAIIYVGWDGTDAHQGAWHATAAYESLYESGLSDVMKKLVVFLINQGGINSRDVVPLLDQISTKGLSMAVSIPEQGPPLPQAVVVVHEGKQFGDFLTRFIERAGRGELEVQRREVSGRQVTSFMLPPGGPPVEFGWWAEGNHLVIAGGINIVESTIAIADGDSPNITTHSLWKQAREAEFEVSLASWIDFAAVRARFGEFPIPHPDPNVQMLTINRVLQALGMENLGPLVYHSGYQGRALMSEMFLDAPAPRTGLLALWDRQPMSIDDLPPMPANTPGFYARNLDWSELYSSLYSMMQDVATLGPPDAADQLDAMYDQIPAVLGIDLEEDLFEPLGDVVCIYGDQAQGFFGFGAVLAIKVDDPAKLKGTISNLMLRLAATAGPEILVRSVSKHGREITVLQSAEVPVAPSLVVDDDWLVIGLTSQAVESFLLRKDGRLPRWEATGEYQEALAQMPDQFTGLTVTDPRETVKSLLGFAPMMMTFMQFGMNQASRFGQPAPGMPFLADEIPPTELVTGPLFPNVAVCSVDDDGIRWSARTSIPSIPFATSLGGGSSVAVTGTLVALLLPAVQQARTAARRSQSRNNMKQIGLAMHNYHDTFKHFPPGAHPNDDLEVEERLSWLADILPFIEQAALYEQTDFDKAWDANGNAIVAGTVIPAYINPQHPGPHVTEDGRAVTHYVGMAGVGEDGPTLPAGHPRAGVFAYDRATRFRDITDGTSNTIAVSEASGITGPWSRAGKSTIRPLTEQPYVNGPDGLGKAFRGGMNVLMCDGSVRFVSENIDPTVMENLVKMADGNVLGDF